MTNETIVDILAEMRKVRGFSVPYAPSGHNGVWVADLVEFAERIEAAWQRERAEVRMLAATTVVEVPPDKFGNGAVLLPALQDLCNAAQKVVVLRGHDADDLRDLGFYMDKAKLALQAKPRNCDLPFIEDRFAEHCNDEEICFDCKYNKCDDGGIGGVGQLDCDGLWLLDTAKEEGGSK